VPATTTCMLAAAASMLTAPTSAHHDYFLIVDKASKLTKKPRSGDRGFFISIVTVRDAATYRRVTN
jgi:hypothetical protein